MLDPYPASPVLRLNPEPLAKPLTAADRLALAEREMEAAIGRWVEATMAHQAERAQSRPISAVRQNVGDGAVRF